MGREIKRVALDFDWPLDKTWKGFLNPWYDYCYPCSDCRSGYYGEVNENGLNLKAKQEYREIGRMLDQRKWAELFTKDVVSEIYHNWYTREKMLQLPFFSRTPVNFADLYRERFRSELPERVMASGCDNIETLDEEDHKVIDFAIELCLEGKLPWQHSKEISYSKRDMNYAIFSSRRKISGEDYKCETCDGESSVWESEYHEKMCDEWESTEPPTGEGWQVWETVSEGSPITPVFATAEELVDYLVDVGTAWGQKYSREAAQAFVKSGWVPSMAVVDGKMYNNIEAAVVMGEKGTDE